MKTKKYLIAMAIFGGMLFTVYTASAYNLDGATTAKIEKAAITKIPAAG